MSRKNKEIESLQDVIDNQSEEIKALKNIIHLKEAHIECMKAMHIQEIATIKHAKILNSKETDFDKNLEKERAIIREGEYLVNKHTGLRVNPLFKDGGYVQDDTDFSYGGFVDEAVYYLRGKRILVKNGKNILKSNHIDDKINKNED